jgi:hypothetical protein
VKQNKPQTAFCLLVITTFFAFAAMASDTHEFFYELRAPKTLKLGPKTRFELVSDLSAGGQILSITEHRGEGGFVIYSPEDQLIFSREQRRAVVVTIDGQPAQVFKLTIPRNPKPADWSQWQRPDYVETTDAMWSFMHKEEPHNRSANVPTDCFAMRYKINDWELPIDNSSQTKTRNTTSHFNGTVKEITRQFNGKIGNLKGNDQVVEMNSECRGFGSGPANDGKHLVQFDLTPRGPDTPAIEFHLYFVVPPLPAGQILVTNTESSAVDVWFFRSDKNYSNNVYIAKNDQEQLRERGGERMTGRVAIKWNNDADFVIGADLTLPKDNSTWVRGEFVGSTKTKLSPILYEWPAILIFKEPK